MKTCLKLGILGLVYFGFMEITHLAIPCSFHVVTGWLCPGCGITRMCVAIIKGHWKEAYEANAFLFVTSPFLMFEFIYCYWLQYTGKTSRINRRILWAYVILLIGWGIVRNV